DRAGRELERSSHPVPRGPDHRAVGRRARTGVCTDARQRERTRARLVQRVVPQPGGGASAMDVARPAGGAASLLRVRRGAAQEPGGDPRMTVFAGSGREGFADAALIDRLRAHDAAALETLMERHGSRVYRVAFGITRNHADAEEVALDVFMTLFRK